MKKGILKIMLGSVILEAILVCIFILVGSFDDVTWKSLGSVGIIFGYSIPCLFYSKIYDDEKYKYIAISGASVVCVSALISILGLWDLISEGEFLGKIVETFNVIIWMLAFISWILSYISVNSLLNLFKKVSISLISLLSFFITIIIWTDSFPEGFLARLYYVLIVLTVGSFICTLILTRIYKKEIVKVSQSEGNMQTNSNIGFVKQSDNTQQSNLQSIDNNQLQNQNSIPTQPVVNSTQPTNSIENIQTNSLNSENAIDNNESDNNI